MLIPKKVFEFGDWFDANGRQLLESQLESLWSNNYNRAEEAEYQHQGFVVFDGEKAKAKNFIGFIQNEKLSLEIYPKVFKDLGLDDRNSSLILQHLFWWLGYCEHWRFPFTQVNLSTMDCSSFPELLINLIADQFLKVITEQPLSLYNDVSASMQTPRGRINFERYLSKGFSYGNAHILECDYEPLVFDNQLNRTIKYVCRLLKNRARFYSTQSKIDDVLYLLDDVSDEPGNVSGLNNIRLNNVFFDYHAVINSCRLVLNDELYGHHLYDQPQWSLLLPMELVFEDFISGFIRQEFGENWIVSSQKGGLSLVEKPAEAFQMRHDLLLTSIADPKRQVIIDTKYKLREHGYWTDAKKGVSQADMYQMTAYGLRRGCKNILLLYPNIGETCNEPDHFFVRSTFDDQEIRITAAEVPFWSINFYLALKSDFKKRLEMLLDII